MEDQSGSALDSLDLAHLASRVKLGQLFSGHGIVARLVF